MSIVDKVIAAVTPPESEKDRAEARAKAQSRAPAGSWLSLVLDHHRQIENAFDMVRSGTTAASRLTAVKQLAGVLTAHSIAEEAVLYPALALNGEKVHSEMGYLEQSVTKVQMSALEDLDPMGQDFLDKLEHIRGAVTHHMYQEEHTWFPELMEKASSSGLQAKLNARFTEEFGRYMGQSPYSTAPTAPAAVSAMASTSTQAL